MPNIENSHNLSRTCAKESLTGSVVRNPLPEITQIISGFLKGANIQNMHMADTMENPT
ncbi:MAG: hypothetical protein WBK90_08245 [Bacillota bacterium]